MCEPLSQLLCVCACVCWIVLQDLCEVVGSVVRNGPVGQPLKEAQHRQGLWTPRALVLLPPAADHRRTHFRGALQRQRLGRQIKFTTTRWFPNGAALSNTHKMLSERAQEILFGQVIQCSSFSARCPTGRRFVRTAEQLSPLSSVSLSVFYLQSPLINRTDRFTCAPNIHFIQFLYLQKENTAPWQINCWQRLQKLNANMLIPFLKDSFHAVSVVHTYSLCNYF